MTLAGPHQATALVSSPEVRPPGHPSSPNVPLPAVRSAPTAPAAPTAAPLTLSCPPARSSHRSSGLFLCWDGQAQGQSCITGSVSLLCGGCPHVRSGSRTRRTHPPRSALSPRMGPDLSGMGGGETLSHCRHGNSRHHGSSEVVLILNVVFSSHLSETLAPAVPHT